MRNFIMNLVRFYRGEEKDHRGRRLSDYWSFGHDSLEAEHDFIQLMFPLTEPSAFQPRAVTLDAAGVAAFRGDEAIQGNLLRSLEVMLDFYGFALDRAGKTVVPGPHFAERAPQWLFPDDHNHLRITRILKCLTLCGLGEYARGFYQALRQVAVPGNKVTTTTLQFWAGAV
jgi:hypothetical protein